MTLPAIVSLLCLAVLVGCYSLRPVPVPPVPPAGTEVRVRYMPAGTGAAVGERRADGRVVASGGGVLTLETRSTPYRRRRGADTVRVRIVDIIELQAKRMDTARTAALLGISGLALGALVVYLFDAAGGSRPPDAPPVPGEPDGVLVPLKTW